MVVEPTVLVIVLPPEVMVVTTARVVTADGLTPLAPLAEATALVTAGAGIVPAKAEVAAPAVPEPEALEGQFASRSQSI